MSHPKVDRSALILHHSKVTLFVQGQLDPKQASDLLARLTPLGVDRVVLLKYNQLWEVKLDRLRTSQRILGLSDDELDYESICQAFSSRGLFATIGG